MKGVSGWSSRMVLVGLGLAVIGACSSDAPGGDGNPASARITVSFLRHDNPTYLVADREFFAVYMASHPNVTIADVSVDFRTLATALNNDLKADRFNYDLVLVPPGRICSYADQITDVPAEIATLEQAQQLFFAAPLEGATCAGRLKGLPMEYNLEYGGVVVNLDKYQAKYPNKTPAWADWKAFIAEAAALAEYDDVGAPKANGLDIDPIWSPPARHILFAQILQRGGRFLSTRGDNTLDLETPEAKASLAAMVDWVNKDKIMFPGLVPDKNTSVPARLAGGASGYGWNDVNKPLSVMGYVGTWGVPAIKSLLPATRTVRHEFFPVPPMVGTEHRFVTDSGWAFAVPRSSKNPAAAWDVARSLALSAEAARNWSKVTGALPALRVNGTAEAASADPVLARVQPLLDQGHWRGFIPAEGVDIANAAVVVGFFDTVRGTKTVDQALKDMQNAANDAITRYR
jgi:multiple sugar transport system substrate-binding protein